MRCKACDAALRPVKKNKRIFDPSDEENVLLNEEEDLCNTCWTIAKDCYLGYTSSAAELEAEIQSWWYGASRDNSPYEVVGEIMEKGSIMMEEV